MWHFHYNTISLSLNDMECVRSSVLSAKDPLSCNFFQAVLAHFGQDAMDETDQASSVSSPD